LEKITVDQVPANTVGSNIDNNHMNNSTYPNTSESMKSTDHNIDSTSSKHSRMQNKEVQTEFPASMLEDYILENRRRVLKLLRYPQGGSNIFKDLPSSRINDELKTSMNPHSVTKYPNVSNSPKSFNKRIGLCDSLSSSAECLSPPLRPKKIQSASPRFCHQYSVPSSASPSILDSSELIHKHQQGCCSSILRSTSHPYSHSFDNQEFDTVNFQPLLQKPPRNLALSGNTVEEELKFQKEGKGSAKIGTSKVRFASEGGDIIRPPTNRPTSCLSLGMH
jgi:hypothetical protein